MILLMKCVYGCPIFCASYLHNNYDGDGPSYEVKEPCFLVVLKKIP